MLHVVLFIECRLLFINKVCTPSFDQPLEKFRVNLSVFSDQSFQEFVTILMLLNDFSLIMILYERLEYINGSQLILQHFLIFKPFIVTIFPMITNTLYLNPAIARKPEEQTEITCSVRLKRFMAKGTRKRRKRNFPQIHKGKFVIQQIFIILRICIYWLYVYIVRVDEPLFH